MTAGRATPMSTLAGLDQPRQSPGPDQIRWFAEEVQPHDGALKAYLRGSYPAIRDIDDVVQESYLRVWKRHAAQPIASAKSFLFSVARHLAIDVLRHQERSPIEPVTDWPAWAVIEDSPGVAETACLREEIDLLLDAVAALPRRTREVYLLRKFEDLPQRRIAERLGMAENTVEVHVGRANRRCERYLREKGVIRESRT